MDGREFKVKVDISFLAFLRILEVHWPERLLYRAKYEELFWTMRTILGHGVY